MTPLLKNAIDWVSRVKEAGEKPLVAYHGRVFALGSASPGGYGGMRSQIATRQVLELGCGALVIPRAAPCRPPSGLRRRWQAQGRSHARHAHRLLRLPHRQGPELLLMSSAAPIDPRSKLFVALDLPSLGEARGWSRCLGTPLPTTRSATGWAIRTGSPSDGSWRPRQDHLLRPQTARHRQYGARGRRIDRQDRGPLPDGACLSADHEGRRAGPRRLGPEDPGVTILTSWNDLDCAEAGYAGTVATPRSCQGAAGGGHRRRRHCLLGP